MRTKSPIAATVISIVSLLATAAFLLIGFLAGAWHIGWMVFLIIPITTIITEIATGNKNLADAITGIVSILAVITFFLLGFFRGLWHPGWMVFLAIPLTRAIVRLVTASTEYASGKSAEETQDTSSFRSQK